MSDWSRRFHKRSKAVGSAAADVSGSIEPQAWVNALYSTAFVEAARLMLTSSVKDELVGLFHLADCAPNAKKAVYFTAI